jgi:2-polyprenyl-3-methyl-5-hydroxy-6-metoxy-1,4-benzoquinol methylase
MQNYQDKPDAYFAHARQDIAPLLPARTGDVLEIGCGSGATLAWLRAKHAARRTVGVEISAQAATVARGVADEVHCLDFERDGLPGPSQQFDLVLCLDVLEHMVNPWGVVARLVELHLAPGGTLIVSVPNVRHYSVVLPLLASADWRYQEAGILDRTHLRFFTRKTAQELLRHSRLAPVQVLKKVWEPTSRKGVFNLLTMGMLNDFVTYQHLVSAKARE